MSQGTVAIPLTRGKVAVVDAVDAPRLVGYKWQASLDPRGLIWYARRGEYLPGGGQRTIRMHRQIMDAPPDREVDHINGDGLDNRRCNLRICTQAQNKKNQRRPTNNTSGYLGVGRLEGRWSATMAGEYLGLYDTPEEAARAYDTHARAKQGAFAHLNFPDEQSDVAPRRGGVCRISTSGFRGVSYRPKAKGRRKWTARLTHQGKRLFLGYFLTAEDAAEALAAKNALL